MHGRIKAKVFAIFLGVMLISSSIGGIGGYWIASQVLPATTTTTNTTIQKVSTETVNTEDIVAAIKDSVVEINTSTQVRGYGRQTYTAEGAGSGVILTSDGYIITNNHVIEGAQTITVRTTDGTEYEATVIDSDSENDLAVLKIDAENLTSAKLGTSSTLQVGEYVLAVGNPLGQLGGTVTEGILSATDREITVDETTMTLLQTSAAINSGNSGGGLFNASGELIGVVNAKSSGLAIEGLGFAIPIDTVREYINSITNVQIQTNI